MPSRFLSSLCALLLVVALAPASARGDDGRGLTTQQWRQDIDYLESTILAVHPDPFLRIQRSGFEANLAELRAGAAKLEKDEMVVALMRFVARMQDGHSALGPDGPFADFGHLFQIRIARFSEGLFVTAAPSHHADLLGARIETYGKLPAEEAWRRASEISDGDNRFSKEFRTTWILTLARAMQVLGAVDGDQLELGLVMPDGSRRAVNLPAVDGSTSRIWIYINNGLPDFAEHVDIHNTLGDRLDLAYSRTNEFYWHHFIEDQRTFYARFKVFLNPGDLPIPGFNASHPTLNAFIADMWEVFDGSEAERLVIDIRDNPGGNNRLLAPLLDGITARPAINQRGRLYAITGRATYSAAMNCVSLLDERTEVLFVGEPAGGSPIHAGDSTGFSLPNSKLRFNMSTYRWQIGTMPWQQEAWIMPQIPVAPRASDYFAGRDGALRAILDGAVPLSDLLMEAHDGGGLEAAQARYADFREHHPDTNWWTPASDLLELAQRLEDADKDDAALEVREWAAAEFPGSLSAWIMLGKTLMESGNASGARAAFEAASRVDPANRFARRLAAAMTK